MKGNFFFFSVTYTHFFIPHYEAWCCLHISISDAGMLRDDTIIEPFEANEEELLKVHSRRYLNSLRVRTFPMHYICQYSCLSLIFYFLAILKIVFWKFISVSALAQRINNGYYYSQEWYFCICYPHLLI